MDVIKVRLSNDCNSTSFWLIIIAQLAFSSVFNVDYFHTAAYLVRSPQLAKDTYILADFMRLVRPSV